MGLDPAIIAKALGGMAAGIGDPESTGARLGAIGADMAESEIMRQQQERARKEAEKKKKGAFGGKAGSMLGTIIGTALAPVTGGSSLVLAGLGSGLGSAAGQALGGGEVDWGQAATSGVTTGLTAGMAPDVFGTMGMDKLAGLPGSMGSAVAENAGFLGKFAPGVGQGMGMLAQSQLLQSPWTYLMGTMGQKNEQKNEQKNDEFDSEFFAKHGGGI